MGDPNKTAIIPEFAIKVTDVDANPDGHVDNDDASDGFEVEDDEARDGFEVEDDEARDGFQIERHGDGIEEKHTANLGLPRSSSDGFGLPRLTSDGFGMGRTLSTMSVSSQGRDNVLGDLQNDVSVGLAIMSKTHDDYMSMYGTKAPTPMAFVNKYIRDEHHTTSLKILNDLNAKFSKKKVKSMSQMVQEVWSTKVSIFEAWLQEVLEDFHLSHPQAVQPLVELKNAFEALFHHGITEQGVITDAMCRTKSEIAALKITEEEADQDVFKIIQQLMHSGVIELDFRCQREQLLSLHNNVISMQEITAGLVLSCFSSGKITANERDYIENTLEQIAEPAIVYGPGRVAIFVNYSPEVFTIGEDTIISFCRLAKALDAGPDLDSVQFVFLILSSDKTETATDELSQHIVRMFADTKFRQHALTATGDVEFEGALTEFVGRNLQGEIPKEREHDDGFSTKGGPFKGIREDIARRLPHYIADFKDGLRPKCLSVSLFLWFACLSPAIAFGGLMSEKTGGTLGVVEMIIATGICSIAFAFFAGQPVIILGGTGPLLVFTETLYDWCVNKLGMTNEQFLEAYCIVGLWSAFFLFLCAIFNVSKYMKYCTRFTDEIFAGLISIIFIYEALHNLYDEWEHDHDRETFYISALWALCLFSTVSLIFRFKDFKTSNYTIKVVRKSIGNFSPIISMIIMSCVAYGFNGSELGLPSINIPSKGFAPSYPREWLVNIGGLEVWLYFAAIIPALLVTILLYLDQNITSRIINAADTKLKKGPAYHLDMLILAILIAVCSILGLPWLVAATVRSLSHLNSLTKFGNNEKYSKPVIISVIETRVTGLLIGILVMLSVLFVEVLTFIPLAVLGGIFLFMGLGSLNGNQFIDRIRFMLMDPKLLPDAKASNISRRRVHVFTLIQIVCLIILWVVKATDAALFFPLFILLLVPLRTLLGKYVFSQHELAILDAEDESEIKLGM